MSTRAQLSETINRLLPGEQNKRIREAILQAASYSGSRTDQLRQSIDLANRVRTGLLVTGTVDFASPTSATLAGFAWAVDFAVQQQEGPDTLTVLAPHATYPRPDSFVGKADGTVEYRAGILDAFGNAKAATLAANEVLLASVSRNPDESNDITPVDPTIPNVSHAGLPDLQGGKPSLGTSPAEHYHLSKEELLKIQNLIANINANAVTQFGTLTYTSATSATLANWKWIIGGVEFTELSETFVVTGTPATYPRPELWVGKEDGTIDYRPATIDEFGNPVYPTILANEVLLAVGLRDPDGNNSQIPIGDFLASPFPDQLYQTAVQADTTGLYAKVWEATIADNNTYHLQLSYGAPSAEADWDTNPSGRSGLLNLTFFCLAGLAITGIHFETQDGKSEPGDWALIRNGSTVRLYHKSTNFWMRVYYRVIFLAGAANKAQLFNRQPYAALPSSDQLFESEPMAGGGAGGGIGITLNGKVIGGVKRLIEESDVLNIPANWEYNVTSLVVDGIINNEGNITIL